MATSAFPERPSTADPSTTGSPHGSGRLVSLLRVGAVLTVVGVAGVWAAGLFAGASVPDVVETRPIPVLSGTIQMADGHVVTQRYTGRLVPPRASVLGFERGGRVDAITVDDGATIAAGTVLARLDTAILDANRQALAARRAEAQAALALAEATLGRQSELVARGHASAQVFDEARFAVDAETARIAALDAEIAMIDIDLDKSVLRAPYNAVVAHRHIDEGTVVAGGAPVFDILEAGRQEARIGVPEAVAAEIAVGDTLSIRVDGTPVTAAVTAILPRLDTRTRTVTLVVALDGPHDAVITAVPAGALIQLELARTVRGQGAWVPLAALAEGIRGSWTIYALAPDPLAPEPGVPAPPTAIVERHMVEVVHVESDRAFVRGTLADGDSVILAGVHRVVPGQRVNAIAADGAAIRPDRSTQSPGGAGGDLTLSLSGDGADNGAASDTQGLSQ